MTTARKEAEAGISWSCELRKVYAETNLGLKRRFETGLDIVFSKEEQAIVLEDDCHPSQDFIPFCEAMLEKYRHELQVAAVSGNCFLPKSKVCTTDYYFSRYLHIWGWATWARAWNSHHPQQWCWPTGGYRSLFPRAEKAECCYWDRIFGRVTRGEIHTWDYPWAAHLWSQGWLSITPTQNLVTNIGFGPEATNTKDGTVGEGVERQHPLPPPYRGPAAISPDLGLDREVFHNHQLKMEGKLGFLPRLERSFQKRMAWARPK